MKTKIWTELEQVIVVDSYFVVVILPSLTCSRIDDNYSFGIYDLGIFIMRILSVFLLDLMICAISEFFVALSQFILAVTLVYLVNK